MISLLFCLKEERRKSDRQGQCLLARLERSCWSGPVPGEGSPILSRSVPQLSTRIPSHGDTPSMYCEAKRGSRTYQAVKQQLFRAFQKAGLGTWVRKPPEQDQFLLML